jgi:aspartate aminotransferase-like enzyme/GNAT superfamily N-acetyltransferase
MSNPVPLVEFKIATEPWEFEQIHRLNHATFAGEIPQHAPTGDGRLVDRFHAENTYLIGLREQRLVAMLAVRDRRPFSLDAKLPGLDRLLPPHRAVVEIRLFSVARDCRGSAGVAQRLLEFTIRYCLDHGHDLALISGTTRQLKLYTHMGFQPFGPLVGPADAQYQPMFLTPDAWLAAAERSRSLRGPIGDAVNFLPGPVTIPAEVRAALAQPLISHRSAEFMELFDDVRRRLCRLAHAPHVQMLFGSGTLANDVVAGQLSLSDRPGVVLVSGEFGARLADHARRWRLAFTAVERPWGHVFTEAELDAELARAPGAGWLWAVHLETSTGVLQDLPMLKRAARRHRLALALDCISSLANEPLDLEGVALASATSGKGLASCAGLAMVFHAGSAAVQPARLPRYLDLGYYAEHGGVPFTQSSNLLRALHAALPAAEIPGRHPARRQHGVWLRAELRRHGFTLAVGEEAATSAITTIVLEPGISAEKIGWDLERRGFLVSYRSGYLLKRNWLQIALMGAYPHDRLATLVGLLARLAGHPPAAETPALLAAEKAG